MSKISNTAMHQLLIREVHTDQDDTLIAQWQIDRLIFPNLLFQKAQTEEGKNATICFTEAMSSQKYGYWENTVLTDRILASKMRLDN